MREIAKQFIRFKVGDGSRIFLWYDVWHPASCLIEKFGFRAVYDAGSYVGARVSSIIRNGEWFFCPLLVRIVYIVAIQSQLPEVGFGDTD